MGILMQVIVLLLLLLHQAVPANAAVSVDETDREALLAFKAGISDFSGTLSSWNRSNPDFCQWKGVTCSNSSQPLRVSAVALPSSGLVGTISPAVGNLTFLQSLNLTSNRLYGEIPAAIGSLRRLEYLNLGNNSLHGEIPGELCNCSSLVYIRLDSNILTGSIPASFGAMSKLESIFLYLNNLTGPIPPSFVNLSSLRDVYLYKNNLEGAIPEGLARLRNLRGVMLSINRLSGTLPPQFFNTSSLYYLEVTMNQLRGSIPADIGATAPNFRYLLLGDNLFSGPVPASISNCTKMEGLSLSINDFTGPIPAELGRLCPFYLELGKNHFVARDAKDWDFMTFLTNCSRLAAIDLSHNGLGGMLPSSIANLSTGIQSINLLRNNLTGTIPPGIGNLASLANLMLQENLLTGAIPAEIGRLQQLQMLWLYENSLSGQIPASLGNLTLLQKLQLGNNRLQGIIPASLGQLKGLTLLYLGFNSLTGPVPKEFFGLSSLAIALELSGNQLSGSLHPEVGRLRNLRYLGISWNNFSGEIPEEIGDCEVMETLSMDSNFFSGSIPPSLGNLKGLEALNLTSNDLSGPIPDELGRIAGLQELYLARNGLSGGIPALLGNLSSLVMLDLSYNRLEGPVLSNGVFANISAFSVNGNSGLCGGVPKLSLPPCPARRVKRARRSPRLFLEILIPVALVCLLIPFVLHIFLSNTRSRSKTRAEASFLDNYPRVSYNELAKATGGFAPSNLIGVGKYGSVYRGTLPPITKDSGSSEEVAVAVKVFHLRQVSSSKSFVAECDALRRVRHRNVIGILTCCSSIDHRGDEFKALVFKLMPKYSLDRWLHQEDFNRLSLIQRMNIAIDVSTALCYFHNDCRPPVVHCDLKPSNILLDDDFTARVGDFGLAKIVSDSTIQQPIVDSANSVGIRGTVGYVAPEYGVGGEVSTTGDVYSFGIVLLEMILGKAPTDEMFGDDLSLHQFAATASPDNVLQVVDPVLVPDDDDNARREISDCLSAVVRVGVSCSKQLPSERMGIGNSALELRAVRDAYLNTFH